MQSRERNSSRLLHLGVEAIEKGAFASPLTKVTTLKMVLDTTLLNTQHYKVRFKGKVEQSWEWSSALPLHLGVVAIEKGAFGSPSTMDYNIQGTGVSPMAPETGVYSQIKSLQRLKNST